MTRRGEKESPEYRSWAAMKQRATNSKNEAWDRYGGAGITVCDRWTDFQAFYADMGPKPSPKHSIDRIDNDRGYEPDNCRWATDMEQALNKRIPARRVFFDGKHLTIRELSAATGIPISTLYGKWDGSEEDLHRRIVAR